LCGVPLVFACFYHSAIGSDENGIQGICWAAVDGGGDLKMTVVKAEDLAWAQKKRLRLGKEFCRSTWI
jgi:hypothetical protein